MSGNGRRFIVALVALVFAIGSCAFAETDPEAPDADVKAAFLFNFAKFTDWPEIAFSDPILLCVLDDARIAGALVKITRGQRIDSHRIDVRPVDSANGQPCHLLFLSAHSRDLGSTLRMLDGLPVLTVSDSAGFAGTGGMIELYVERDRIRFAIAVETIKRSHLTVSSRLLGLARIIHDDRPQ